MFEWWMCFMRKMLDKINLSRTIKKQNQIFELNWGKDKKEKKEIRKINKFAPEKVRTLKELNCWDSNKNKDSKSYC